MAKGPGRERTGKRKNGRLRRVLLGLVAVFAALSVLPYLFPLAEYDPETIGVPDANGRYADIGGRTVYSRVFPPAEDVAFRGRILLVHGFGGSTASWNLAAPRLAADGWFVLAADVPGFGYSEKKRIDRTYDHEANARDLWALAATVGEDGPQGRDGWVLVGHSMGGGIVARMAARHPERTARVVLVDGAVYGSRRELFDLMGLAQGALGYPPLSRAATVVVDRLLRNPETLRDLLASAYGRQPTDGELDSYYRPVAVPGTAASLLAITRSDASSEGVERRLAAAGVPVSLIWGSLDAWVEVSQGAALSELLGVPLRLVEGAGHCPMETHPDRFLEILREELGEGAP
jgi:pimeloyl-ACP methyl ester carboxylesterase